MWKSREKITDFMTMASLFDKQEPTEQEKKIIDAVNNLLDSDYKEKFWTVLEFTEYFLIETLIKIFRDDNEEIPLDLEGIKKWQALEQAYKQKCDENQKLKNAKALEIGIPVAIAAIAWIVVSAFHLPKDCPTSSNTVNSIQQFVK